MKTTYRAPDFSETRFREAPDAQFEPAPLDGALPERFFSTTNLPTYVKLDGEWRLPRRPRMDSAIILEPDGSLVVREGRLVRSGERVAIGLAEDGSEGIFVHASAFMMQPEPGDEGEFQFMSSDVSREKPVDYAAIAELIRAERDRGGHVVWVLGPAVLHSRGRDVITWFIENGYVGAVLGGNAVAVHDIEQALLGTTLGMGHGGRPVAGGHAYHMRAINRIRSIGSIAGAVDQGILTEGVMHACVTCGVPYVLAGSIRDDGPLPEVVTDTLRAQETMREHASRATMAIMIATALHTIAFGNMLPAYVDADGDPSKIRPLTTVAVDSSEFVVNKLKDRGTHQAFGVITNAQDFLYVLRRFMETTEPAADPSRAAADILEAGPGSGGPPVGAGS